MAEGVSPTEANLMEEDFAGFQEEDDFIQVSQRKNANQLSLFPKRLQLKSHNSQGKKTTNKHREIKSWKLKLNA